MIKMRRIIALFLAITVVTSCSKFHQVSKSSDIEAKYNAGVKYYEKKDYYHALQLFEELITIYRGTSKAEQSYYYYCYCTYNVDDYQTAAYHFNNFIQTYPASKHAEEIQFMYAYCFYQDSPIATLDQTSTLDAIDKFQIFTNRFPSSPKVTEANQLIDELRLKLETKDFQNARLYLKTENYKAAVYAFDNLQKDFPSTIYKEEALFLALKAEYLYAINSIEAKRKERYTATVELYYKLVDNFPQSRYLRDAEKIFENAKSKISYVKGAGGS
jgi:outer membrane protein assembly factor BamD